MAVSTGIRPARHAGHRAAARPPTSASRANTASCAAGMARTLIPWGASTLEQHAEHEAEAKPQQGAERGKEESLQRHHAPHLCA